MPRKKKKTAGEGKSSESPQRIVLGSSTPVVPPQAWHKPPGGAVAVPDTKDESKMKELRYLQEMFNKKLDPVVVHMIMEDCDYKVDAALETLFKLAEDSEPGDDDNDDDSKLSLKNIYPVHQQEAWGAATPEDDNATVNALTGESIGWKKQNGKGRNIDSFPPLSDIHDQKIPLNTLSDSKKLPIVNGYQSSSDNNLPPNQPSSDNIPQPSEILVDNSMFYFDETAARAGATAGGARPKSKEKFQWSQLVENSGRENNNVNNEISNYFRLPLPDEDRNHFKPNDKWDSDAAFYAGDPITSFTVSSAGFNPTPGANAKQSSGRTIQRQIDSTLPATSSNIGDKTSVDDIMTSDNVVDRKTTDSDTIPIGNLNLGVQAIVNRSILLPAQGVSDNSEGFSGSLLNQIATGRKGGLITRGDQDKDEQLDQGNSHATSESTYPATECHIMTNEDDDMISVIVDSDDDNEFVLALEDELADTFPDKTPDVQQRHQAAPPTSFQWQRSLTESENEWDTLMKEIDASADHIHRVESVSSSSEQEAESLSQSVQDFILENTPSVVIEEEWMATSTGLDAKDCKKSFPEYSLFPSLLLSSDNIPGSDDDDNVVERQTFNKDADSAAEAAVEDKGSPTSSNCSDIPTQENESALPSLKKAYQLPVIKAELRIAAKEFVPRPTQEVDATSTKPKFQTPMQPISRPRPTLEQSEPNGMRVTRPPFHGQQPIPFQATFPGMANSPPFRLMQTMPIGNYPPGMQPFPGPPGRGFRPAPPRMLPPGARPMMPIGPPGSGPGGPIPAGVLPRYVQSGNHPGMPIHSSMIPNHQPRMRGPGNRPRTPGPPPPHQRMISGRPPMFPQPLSRSAGPMPLRHPLPSYPPGSQSPVFTVPSSSGPRSVASPPLLSSHSPHHKLGLVGAPRWPHVQTSIVRKPDELESTKKHDAPLPSNKKVMCLMRGCPGSGKSTLARKLVGEKGVILSTDDFFTSKDGQYKFDVNMLTDAHERNRLKALKSCRDGLSPIIIDNTNTQGWEMKPYVSMAVKNDYHVEFREPSTPWKDNPKQLAKKTSHGVPLDRLEKMLARYDHNVTVDSILNPKTHKLNLNTAKEENMKRDDEKTGPSPKEDSAEETNVEEKRSCFLKDAAKENSPSATNETVEVREDMMSTVTWRQTSNKDVVEEDNIIPIAAGKQECQPHSSQEQQSSHQHSDHEDGITIVSVAEGQCHAQNVSLEQENEIAKCVQGLVIDASSKSSSHTDINEKGCFLPSVSDEQICIKENLSHLESNQIELDLEKDITDVQDKEITGVLDKEITDVLDKEITGVLDKEITDVLDKEITDVLDKEITNEITDVLDKEITDVLDKEITDVLDKEITDALNSEMTDVLDREITDVLDREFSNMHLVKENTPKIGADTLQLTVPIAVIDEDDIRSKDKEVMSCRVEDIPIKEQCKDSPGPEPHIVKEEIDQDMDAKHLSFEECHIEDTVKSELLTSLQSRYDGIHDEENHIHAKSVLSGGGSEKVMQSSTTLEECLDPSIPQTFKAEPDKSNADSSTYYLTTEHNCDLQQYQSQAFQTNHQPILKSQLPINNEIDTGTVESIPVNNIDSLQKARQYAIELTKQISAKYADAPCSRCIDNINSLNKHDHNVTDKNEEVLPSVIQDSTSTDKDNTSDADVTCEKMKYSNAKMDSNFDFAAGEDSSLPDNNTSIVALETDYTIQNIKEEKVFGEGDVEKVQSDDESYPTVDTENTVISSIPLLSQDSISTSLSDVENTESQSTTKSLESKSSTREIHSVTIPAEASKVVNRQSPHTTRLAAVFSESFTSLPDVNETKDTKQPQSFTSLQDVTDQQSLTSQKDMYETKDPQSLTNLQDVSATKDVTDPQSLTSQKDVYETKDTKDPQSLTNLHDVSATKDLTDSQSLTSLQDLNETKDTNKFTSLLQNIAETKVVTDPQSFTSQKDMCETKDNTNPKTITSSPDVDGTKDMQPFTSPYMLVNTKDSKVDWAFPSHVEVIPEAETETLSKPADFTESGSQTKQDEFAILQKVECNELYDSDANALGFRVLIGHTDVYLNYIMKQIADSNDQSSDVKTDFDIPSSRNLDKSTMTEDEARERTESTSLQDLQSVFPHVPPESLQGVLNDCLGDVEWATNILIDSGYTDSQEESILPDALDEKSSAKDTDHNGEVSIPQVFIPVSTTNTFHQSQSSIDSSIPEPSPSPDMPSDDDMKDKSDQNTKDTEQPFQETDTGNSCDIERESKQNENKSIPSCLPNNAINIPISVSGDLSKTSPCSLQAICNASLHQRDHLTSVLKSSAINAPELIMAVNRNPKFITEDYPVDRWNLHINSVEGASKVESDRGQPDQVKGHENTGRNMGLKVKEDARQKMQCNMEADHKHMLQGPTNKSSSQQAVTDGEQLCVSKLKGLTVNESALTVPMELLLMPGNTDRLCSQHISVPECKTFSARSMTEKPLPECETLSSQSVPEKRLRSKKLSPSTSSGLTLLTKSYSTEAAECPVATSDASSSVESSPQTQQSSEVYTDEEDGDDGDDEEDDDICGGASQRSRDMLGFDDGVVLQLDAVFALQLQEMFGPVGFHLSPDGLSDEDLEVKISPDIAKELHTLWAKTLQRRFDDEQTQMAHMIQADEQLARKLQQEEEMIHMQQDQKNKKRKDRLSKKAGKDVRAARPPLVGYNHNLLDDDSAAGAAGLSWKQMEVEQQKHLQYIMDEQVARLLVEEEEASNSSPEDSEGKVHTLATKIKRQQLHGQFPSIDKALLDEIFAKYNYELNPTVRDVDKILSAISPPRDVYTDDELIRLEKKQMEQAEKESLAESLLQQAVNETDDARTDTKPSPFQSLNNPHYHDFRAEATAHYRERHECFQKAAAAYGRGLKDLASFYSRQGHAHTELLKAAHRRASDSILESRQWKLDENVLDLHGLHVEEAIETLEQVLQERVIPLQPNISSTIPPLIQRPNYLLIVTGRGKNSPGGVAKIKPAVASYLKKNNYRFTVPNAGLIKVLW